MAKYAILMSCGHEDTVELLGNGKERERKIAYYEKNGLCKKCYKKKMEEQTESEELIFNATVLPYINEENGDIMLSVWFAGNTRPCKDAIKSLGGYKWSERAAAIDFLSTEKPPLCWNKVISLKELSDEITKATSIGADSVVSDKGLFAMINYQIALEKQKEWMDKKDKIESIRKPAIPDILKDCKWNQKVYGKSGNYSIYPDGERVTISDEQAEEIKSYLQEKEEYEKRVKEIKEGEV